MNGALIIMPDVFEDLRICDSAETEGHVSSLKYIVSTLQQAFVSPLVLLTKNGKLIDEYLSRRGILCICPLYGEKFSPKHWERAIYILRSCCEKVFICSLFHPLFCASTLKLLLREEEGLVLPSFLGKAGYPILSSPELLKPLLDNDKMPDPQDIVSSPSFHAKILPTEDEGILFRIEDFRSWKSFLPSFQEMRCRPVSKLMIAGESIFLGPGIYQLLRATERCRSLKNASLLTGLSYSKCRIIIKRLEEEIGFRVLKSQKGGSEGGYSALTPRGRILLENYALYVQDCSALIDSAFHAFSKRLREELDECHDESDECAGP